MVTLSGLILYYLLDQYRESDAYVLWVFCTLHICHDHLLDPELKPRLSDSDYYNYKLQSQEFHEYFFK